MEDGEYTCSMDGVLHEKHVILDGFEEFVVILLLLDCDGYR